MTRASEQRAIKKRRGTLLLAVLACLTLCAMLLTFWLRLIAIERRQVRSYQSAMQTELLADAALARGTLKAIADPEYRGETWQPDADPLISPRATITVVAGEEAETRQLVVAVETGAGSKQSVRRMRTLAIPKSTASPMSEATIPANPLPAEEPAS